MDKRTEIAKNIEMLVKASGKTQTEIALAVGVNRVTVNDYISGKGLPSVLIVIKLCKVLDCDYADILGRLD